MFYYRIISDDNDHKGIFHGILIDFDCFENRFISLNNIWIFFNELPIVLENCSQAMLCSTI